MKLFLLLIFAFAGIASAQSPIPKISIGVEESSSVDDITVTLEIVALMTILTLVPSILIMMTSFTRIVVVLNFLKQAMGTQNAPPQQVVMGMSMFLTFFIMAPVFNEMNANALQPYLAEEIKWDEALEKAKKPIRDFMLRQTKEEELALFLRIGKDENPESVDDLSMLTIIPAFMLSELKTAFMIGFLLYIPFLVIDMTVASVLMAMGMMMLPPAMISMPFKLILFVIVDGWSMVVQQVVLSFR